MKRKVVQFTSFLFIISSVLYLSGCGKLKDNNSKKDVTIANKRTHFEVVLNYENGTSHKELGENLAKEILQDVPDYESILDSYFVEMLDSEYETMIDRANDIKPQINQMYIDEIEGMASVFSGGDQNILGDGKISKDELYIMNLMADVLRGTQCSALAVYGASSKTKNTISARLLDWYGGAEDQLAKIQAVITYKNNDQSICTIGYLGYIGVITGFNDDKVYAAILDSSTGGTYSSETKNSYPLDLRYALENYSTINDIGSYLKSPERDYAFSHLIFMCDANTSKVLENNISSKENSIRDFRTEQSKLYTSIQWDTDNSIGCVNSFLLPEHSSNHLPHRYNTKRWDRMKKELNSKGPEVSVKELKEIASVYSEKRPGQNIGDLYNANTQQIVIFQPENFNLEIYFRPKNGVLQAKPRFKKIRVEFE